MSDLSNQIAVVTGGGSGIGESIAKELSRHRAKVYIVDINRASAERVADEIVEKGFEAVAYGLDVSDSAGVAQLFNHIEQKEGKLDILINNAGIAGTPSLLTDMTDQDWERMLHIHAFGTFYCMREASKLMKKNRYGRIVNMSSLAAERGLAGNAHYSAAKYAIVGLTEVAAKELGSFNITVNAIKPGLIRTPLAADGLLANVEHRLREATPVKKIGEPRDVARAVSFLVKPDSQFLTGVSLVIDGGMNLKDEQDAVMLELLETESIS